MKYFKRMVLIFICIMSFSLKINAETDFNLQIVSRTTKNIQGVQHQKMVVKMRYNGVITNQQINYIGANLATNKNISLVALDNFVNNDLDRGTLREQMRVANERYPNSKVVAAVNADYFDINSPIQKAAIRGPHIRDGNVIFEGFDYNGAFSVGVRTDGSAFIDTITYQGYHIEVSDEVGALKQKKLPVKINQLPSNDDDLVVLMPSFSAENAKLLTGRKMIINVNEYITHKTVGGNDRGRYFAKGYVGSITEEPLDHIEEGTMVLMGNDFFLEDLITSTDLVKLHNKPSEQFSDVYHAVSGLMLFLKDGVDMYIPNDTYFTFPAPRTAVGLKADGTLFFVTIDGRQAPEFEGVTIAQLNEIMKFFGAVTAFNLDGGGSVTMAVLDAATDEYVVTNSPSDGFERQNGNGMGFIVGDIELPLAPIPYPDTRTALSMVENVIFENNTIRFNAVDDASKYVVSIDGKKYTTEENSLHVSLPEGQYDLTVQAFGNHATHKQSASSDIFSINIFSSPMQGVLEHLRQYGKDTHGYLND